MVDTRLLYNSTSFNDTLERYRPSDWTTVPSTITSQTGTLTNASGTLDYNKQAGIVHFRLTVNAVNNGTGATYLKFTLPFAPEGTWIVPGRDVVLSGDAVIASLSFTGENIITLYDGGYPASTGSILIISGMYRTLA